MAPRPLELAKSNIYHRMVRPFELPVFFRFRTALDFAAVHEE